MSDRIIENIKHLDRDLKFLSFVQTDKRKLFTKNKDVIVSAIILEINSVMNNIKQNNLNKSNLKE